MMFLYYIPLNKGEKTSVEGVVGTSKTIFVSHYIQGCGKANHKLRMLVKTRFLGKARKEKRATKKLLTTKGLTQPNLAP
jgi:hypothetical protein